MPTSSANPLRVLIVQGGIGCAWLFGAPHLTNTNAYKPAVQFLGGLPFYPMRAWGGLLVGIAVGLALAMRNSRSWHWSTALAMFWAFWVVQFTAATFTRSGGIAPIFFALGFAWYAFERATPRRRKR